jgi:hypothetical protein
VDLMPEHLDKVMAELVAVSRSATSKREEASNLARIWGRSVEEPVNTPLRKPGGRHRRVIADAV